MSKLFKIKNWVTPQQGLEFLSLQLGEEVQTLDILQLITEGELKISIKLSHRSPAQLGKVVPLKEVPISELPNLKGDGTISYLNGYSLSHKGDYTEETPFACFDKEVSYIDGIWDLAMIGNEAIHVSNMLREEMGAEQMDLISISGTFLIRPDGTCASLQESFRPEDGVNGFFPASGLPENSVLIFRTEELKRFISVLDGSQDREKPLETRERNTLLSIIGVLCKEAGHDFNKSAKAAAIIQSTAAQMGVSLGESTIESHLKKVADALATRMK
nr:hypothetical protein [Delftia acidovorans]